MTYTSIDNNVTSTLQTLHLNRQLPLPFWAIRDQAFQAVKTFQPMSLAQVEALTGKTKEAALAVRIERSKALEDFDWASHDPASMG